MDLIRLWAGPFVTGVVAALVGFAAWALQAPPATDGGNVADWAQVIVAIAGVGVTALAIFWSVRAGYLHQDRQARMQEAEQFKAAYLLARAAGAKVIEIERWLRPGATVDPAVLAKDQKRVTNYPAAWAAWIEDRYAGYLEALSKVQITTLADAAFLDNLLSVRSRLRWLSSAVSPTLGTDDSSYSCDTLARLQWAARDVIEALSTMRARTDQALRNAGLPAISAVEARPFPETSPPPNLNSGDQAVWVSRLKRS